MPARTLVTLLFLLLSFSIFSQTNPHHVWVRGHYRSGKYIEGHYRTAPNHTNVDNFSTRGNINPYTLQLGYIAPDNQVNPWKDLTKEETIHLEEYTPAVRPKLHTTELITLSTYTSNTADAFTGKFYSKGDQVNVRQYANLQSRIEFRINKGDPITVLSKSITTDFVSGYGSDYWYQIESKGLTGWVFGNLIMKAEEEEKINTPDDMKGVHMTIQADHVNVRSEPSVTEGIIKFKLNKNEEVEMIAKTTNKYSVGNYGKDYWYYVKYGDRLGWVFGGLLRE